MKILNDMKIYDLIKKAKEGKYKKIGPVISSIKNNDELLSELKNETKFLDDSYDNISVSQRFYHLWFAQKSVEKCNFCERPKKFSAYERFSDVRYGKEYSNYNNNCGKIECFIDDIREKNYKGQAFGRAISSFKDNELLMDQLLEKTKFLDEFYMDISISQRFYHIWFNMMEIEKCPYCGDPKKFIFSNKFSNIQYNKKDANYCGTCCKNECNKQYNQIRTKEKLIKKYGTSNLWEIPGYRERFEESNMKKYGVKYYTSTKEFAIKRDEIFEKKFGGHPTKLKSVQDKKKKTNMERYGFECALEDRELMKRSMLKKYGVDHNMKIESVHRQAMKSGSRYYNYKLPSGKIILLQGYEKYGMDYLLETHREIDILTEMDEIKKIIGPIIYDGNLRYYPDFFIISSNKIYEVKSPYTYKMHLEKNLKKRQACLDRGLDFEFLIFNKYGDLLPTPAI